MYFFKDTIFFAKSLNLWVIALIQSIMRSLRKQRCAGRARRRQAVNLTHNDLDFKITTALAAPVEFFFLFCSAGIGQKLPKGSNESPELLWLYAQKLASTSASVIYFALSLALLRPRFCCKRLELPCKYRRTHQLNVDMLAHLIPPRI